MLNIHVRFKLEQMTMSRDPSESLKDKRRKNYDGSCTKLGREVIDSISLLRDKVQCSTFVNMILNIWVPHVGRNLLIRCAHIILSSEICSMRSIYAKLQISTKG